MLYLLALIVFLLAFAGLALGQMLRQRQLKAHCGGHQGLGEPLGCSACDCPDQRTKVRALTLLGRHDPE
jgi:hypothetical protein